MSHMSLFWLTSGFNVGTSSSHNADTSGNGGPCGILQQYEIVELHADEISP